MEGCPIRCLPPGQELVSKVAVQQWNAGPLAHIGIFTVNTVNAANVVAHNFQNKLVYPNYPTFLFLLL